MLNYLQVQVIYSIRLCNYLLCLIYGVAAALLLDRFTGPFRSDYTGVGMMGFNVWEQNNHCR